MRTVPITNPTPPGFTPSPAFLSPPEEWRTPIEPHRVVGGLYAVGTTDLGVYLITTEEGHILINTGIQGSSALIRRNVERLGFHLEDVEILLSMQSHWDHTGALADIKDETGAALWATAKDARVLADGGFTDPQFGGGETFRPVSVDEIIAHGEVIRLGGTELTIHEHPGHTEGSSSYSMVVPEAGRDLNVVIANMGTVNPGKRLKFDPTYPGVADDFAETFRRQKEMEVDIWVAAHAGHYRLQDKFRPGEETRAGDFEDPAGFQAAIDRLEARYREVLAAEHPT